VVGLLQERGGFFGALARGFKIVGRVEGERSAE